MWGRTRPSPCPPTQPQSTDSGVWSDRRLFTCPLGRRTGGRGAPRRRGAQRRHLPVRGRPLWPSGPSPPPPSSPGENVKESPPRLHPDREQPESRESQTPQGTLTKLSPTNRGSRLRGRKKGAWRNGDRRPATRSRKPWIQTAPSASPFMSPRDRRERGDADSLGEFAGGHPVSAALRGRRRGRRGCRRGRRRWRTAGPRTRRRARAPPGARPP